MFGDIKIKKRVSSTPSGLLGIHGDTTGWEDMQA
jgi:hypothetical protein